MSLPHPATPFFLSSADRPVYSIYHPPGRVRRGAPVVVHCHTVGVGQLATYRPEVLQARAAAAAGYPVLRYHARGYGDSAGNFAEVTFDSLVEDALAAAAEAKARSGAERVIWLGVRFGALVAAEAMRRGEAAAALALWEPVHRSVEYFREMLRGVLFSRVAQGERPNTTVDRLLETVEREGRVDVHGYYLHRAMVESARGAELGTLLDTWTGPTLIAQLQLRPRLAEAHAALARSLEQRGAEVCTALVREAPGWHAISNPPWLGTDLVRQTTEWLDALA